MLKRGFTERQVEENGYKSTPVFGFKSLTKKLLAAGCNVEGVPGANQYANLPPFLREMKQAGTQSVYEAYDMDKLLKTACRGDYNEKC